ncbi:hypothetical protein [Fontibacillus sp. BL9]|uniref:hypothetical protein n=1 Tax=Fontibacillus sp. BL9 TaxID=3389971 RepID=UPI00397C91FD
MYIPNKKLAKALDSAENYETYIASMNNDELIAIITNLENFDEVTTTLTELSIRDEKIVGLYCLEILENDLGMSFFKRLPLICFMESTKKEQKKLLN